MREPKELPPLLTGDEQNQIRQLRDYLVRLAQRPEEDGANTDARTSTDDSGLLDLDARVSNLWNVIYPVGAIYMSTASASPAELFGGSWERIKDAFLLSAGDTYAAGATGGEAAHTLTAGEMPSHRHWISDAAYDDGNMSYSGQNRQDNGLAADAGSYNANDACKTGGRYSAWAGGTAGASGKGSGASASATTAHNNMPPYLAVYVWKRTA